jgi:hypothetical protein
MHSIGWEVPAMVRPMSFLLSFWLAGLFVVGQGAHVPQLLIWALGLFSGFALLGAVISPHVTLAWRVVGPLALCSGLLAVGFIAIAMHSAPWLPFCVLSSTLIYLGVVVAEWIWSPRNRGTMAPADS